MSEYYVLENGEPRPATYEQWRTWRAANRYVRHIGDDTIGGVRVSTVFTGDNCGLDDERPQIFETIIFGGGYDDETHYSTTEEAIAGHYAACARVRDAVRSAPE